MVSNSGIQPFQSRLRKVSKYILCKVGVHHRVAIWYQPALTEWFTAALRYVSKLEIHISQKICVHVHYYLIVVDWVGMKKCKWV